MAKAFAPYLLLLAVALAAGEAAPATPSPAAAKAASDALLGYDETVKAAGAKAAATIKKLMVKYKKDTATVTMLAVKLHKLDPNDADAIAVLKDVPADQQDLLGNAAEPGKYLTDVQAKVIADALAKGKFTAKDWEALPGSIYELKAGSVPMKTGISGKKGAAVLVVPNPDDRWRVAETVPAEDYKDKLYVVINGDKSKVFASPIRKIASDGDVIIDGAVPQSVSGSIRVRVFEVVPIGE